MKVFLDPGHGGKDPGAVGNGLKEKGLTLAIARQTGKLLEAQGVDVLYSRTGDVFVGLSERAAMANQLGAHVFVSIHINSATNTTARGVETFSYPGSAQGERLARAVQNAIVQAKIFSHNRGIKTADFAVLRETAMPAALVELGFIVNAQDAKLLGERQADIAQAIAKGIMGYLGVQPKAPAPKSAPPKTKTESDLAWEWAKAKGLLDGTRERDGVIRLDLAVVLKRFADKAGLRI